MIILNNDRSSYMKSVRTLLLLVIQCLLFVVSVSANGESFESNLNTAPIFEIKNTSSQISVGDGDAKRSVNLDISFPIGDGQFPLIVFSHGHALDNKSYRNLTDYWVERGYIMIAPLHLDSGGDLEATSLITEKYGSDWIAVSRLLELYTVIEQVDQIVTKLEDFQGEVLADKVIAAGHSYGALSSQQLSGANVELKDNSIYPIPSTLVNERVVAVVAVSPPGLMKDHLSEVTWQDYSTPQLVVTGPNDFFPFIWPNYEEHFVSYLTAKPGNNYLLVLDEMDHYLGNLIGRLERDGPPQTLALSNLQEISLQFIEHYLSTDFSENGDTFIQPPSEVSTISKRNGVLRFEHR